MDKKEVILLGFVSVLALLIMLYIGQTTITGRFFGGYEIEEYYQERTFMPDYSYEGVPRIPALPFETKKYTALPEKARLIPEIVEYRVNKITIPPTPYYNFLPLRENRLRTFSGAFGPYSKDPTPYFAVFLCAYAYKIPKAPMRCERVQAAYDPNNGYVSFARGYAPDEYIAYQAVGRDFASLFLVVNDQHGVIIASNIALIKLVRK